MAAVPPDDCPKCNTPRTFERVAPFPPGQEATIGVAWRCPSCGERILVVCALGPAIPSAGSCLNCGADRERGAACGGCGVDDAEMLALCGTEDGWQLDAIRRDAESGQIRRALARANRWLCDHPETVEAWRFKARIYQQLGMHAAAARMLRHAATASATPWLLVSAGFSLQELKRHAEAVEVYREFLALAPGNEHAGAAWCNLANALSALDRDAEAEEAFAKAIELEPTRTTSPHNYYVHLSKRRRWPEAIAVLERALPAVTEPATRVTFLRAMSYAHAEREDGAASLAAAEQALAIDARSIGARYLRGRALALLGRLDEAMVEIRQVLAADPENADALQAIAMLEQAGVRRAKRPWWRFWN
jgi:tetratricopeptide (TPR) repeat protein